MREGTTREDEGSDREYGFHFSTRYTRLATANPIISPAQTPYQKWSFTALPPVARFVSVDYLLRPVLNFQALRFQLLDLRLPFKGSEHAHLLPADLIRGHLEDDERGIEVQFRG